jgi:hypothetical protein
MASTYSDRLKLELQGSGENAGSWGDKTNNNLERRQCIRIYGHSICLSINNDR